MKITGYQHRSVSIPVKYPVVSSVRESKEIDFVLLDILTDEGIKGISYAQGFYLNGSRAIQSCLDLIMPQLVGENPIHIEKIWHQMWQWIKLLGRQGLAAFALSMVDIALWDILGKSLNQPIYKLLGGNRASLEAYASDALWLVPPNEAVVQAEELVDQGFSTLKMRFGRKDPNEDITAIKKNRKAIGSGVEIVCDVNQGWTIDKTISMCKQLEDFKLSWLEEPIDAEDAEGYSELMRRISIPIATGENLYSIQAFHHFLRSGSATVYTPDLQRIGGITGWKIIARLLESYNVSFSSHLFPEISAHLLAAANKSQKLEWMTWSSALFTEPLECKNGVIKIFDKPGLGMSWEENVIKKYSI